MQNRKMGNRFFTRNQSSSQQTDNNVFGNKDKKHGSVVASNRMSYQMFKQPDGSILRKLQFDESSEKPAKLPLIKSPESSSLQLIHGSLSNRGTNLIST
jgi:hypothetical protein